MVINQHDPLEIVIKTYGKPPRIALIDSLRIPLPHSLWLITRCSVEPSVLVLCVVPWLVMVLYLIDMISIIIMPSMFCIPNDPSRLTTHHTTLYHHSQDNFSVYNHPTTPRRLKAGSKADTIHGKSDPNAV